MHHTFIIAILLLMPLAASGGDADGDALSVPTGEVLLHRFDGGGILGALPGAAGRLLPGGVELTAGSAVIAWSGTLYVNGEALACEAVRCQRVIGEDESDAMTTLRRTLLLRRDLPLDLVALQDELKKEEAAFTETGVVSVEAGSVCLDSAGGSGGGAAGVETPQTQVEKTPATLRVKINFD